MPYAKSKYLRIRVRNPSSFIKGSFRTHDIGRKGHSKRIAGRLKRTGQWATQNYLIKKADLGTLKGRKFVSQIKARNRRAKINW